MISMKHLTRDGSDTPAPTSGPDNSNDEALRLRLDRIDPAG